MDILDEDVLKFWRLLHVNDVKYIMIGGFATGLHGFNRMTADVDIWLKDTLDNRKKLRKVIVEWGIGDFKEIETMQLIPCYSCFFLLSNVSFSQISTSAVILLNP